MVRFRSLIPALAIALLVSPEAGGAERLAYHRQAAAVEAYRIDIKAKVPTQGDQHAIIDVSEKAIAVAADGFKAEAEVKGSGSSPGQAKGTYRISSAGDLTELASSEPNVATALKNLALLYVPLADKPVDLGAVWTGQRTLYAPDGSGPVSMPPLRLQVTCTLTRMVDENGKKLAEIAVKAVHAPGETNQADLSGSYRFSPEAGRVVSASIAGVLKVKVSFARVNVPIEVRISK